MELLIENGINYEGISVKSLQFDKVTNRSKAILLKFEKNAPYPYHIHPADNEILVLKAVAKSITKPFHKEITSTHHQETNIVVLRKLVVYYFYPFPKKS